MSIFDEVRGPWSRVADIFVDDSDGHTVTTPYGKTLEERITRTKIISAAPDMFEAIESVLASTSEQWIHDTLRPTIEKVRGKL